MNNVSCCITVLNPQCDSCIGISVIKIFLKTTGGLLDTSWTAKHVIITELKLMLVMHSNV